MTLAPLPDVESSPLVPPVITHLRQELFRHWPTFSKQIPAVLAGLEDLAQTDPLEDFQNVLFKYDPSELFGDGRVRASIKYHLECFLAIQWKRNHHRGQHRNRTTTMAAPGFSILSKEPSKPGCWRKLITRCFNAVSCLLCLSAGCQVCGREEETAAGLPSHGDEQTDPNTARVHSSSDQRDPAVSAAFLSVSAHTGMVYRASVQVCIHVCVRGRVKEETRVENGAPSVSVKDVMKLVLLTE